MASLQDRFRNWLDKNKEVFGFFSNFVLAIMALIVSIVALQIADNQNKITEKTLYPHFQIWFHTQDDNNDEIHDTAYINVTNYGGNFYSIDCTTVSFLGVQPQNGSYMYIPIRGLFVGGYHKNGVDNAYTRVCDAYIPFRLATYNLDPKMGFYVQEIKTLVRIEYQNINGIDQNEYFDLKTGKKLKDAEGEYYFSHHFPDDSYDRDVADCFIYETDSADESIPKIEHIVDSEDAGFDMLRIKPYHQLM